MKFLPKVILGFALFTLFVSATALRKKSRLYVSNYENVLGTSLEIRVKANSQEDATSAENAALAEIDRLSAILSGYDTQSEFNAFLKTSNKSQKLSSELFEVLSLFDAWRLRTKGALDPSAEVIGKVWEKAMHNQQLPDTEELEKAVAIVKETHFQLDKSNRTAVHLDNAPLRLNSFAKSYIISKAAEAAFKEPHVSGIIINIGGDIVIKGALTEPIRIMDPMASADNDLPLTTIKVNNKAVATSGNYRRGYEIKGKWFSHIVDPRSGKPVSEIVSATVVAPVASDAGALATAFNVMRPKESLSMASRLPGVEILLVTRSGERIQSKGWSKLEVPTGSTIGTPLVEHAANDPWNSKYELLIKLEIAKIEGVRSHSPFIAVWVEDKDKNTVRNLSVWYSKPKWLRDLRSWYRGNGATYAENLKNMSSIGSATRSAGKYTLRWDGKNDKGGLVEAGKYTVFIEAAREHGTHQLMSAEMDFNGTAQSLNLNGNIEISAAALEYKKKTEKEN